MADWGKAGTGALGGAATGAGMGAGAGPWGAAIGGAIGGVVGGLGGLFSDEGGDDKDAYRKQLQQLANKWGTRATPQSSGAATAGYSSFRGMQSDAINALRQRALGYGPSAAEIQMRAAMDRAAGAQAAAAAGVSQRGVNAGAALRNASNQAAAIQSQGARDTTMLRAQEQANYLGQWNQGAGMARQQDEALTQFNAQQKNYVAMQNLQAQLQALGINTTGQLQALIAAMQNAPASLGDRMMAGMATAAPGIVQWYQAKQQAKNNEAQQAKNNEAQQAKA